MLNAALGQRMRMPKGGGPSPDTNILVYYHRVLSPPLIALMDQMSADVETWHLRKTLHDLLSIRQLRAAASWNGLLKKVRARIGCPRVDELWMTSISDWPEAALAGAYPEAAVVQYEDGLNVYFGEAEQSVPKAPKTRLLFSRADRQVLWRRFGKYFPCVNPLNIWIALRSARKLSERVHERHLYLGQWLEPRPTPRPCVLHLVSSEALRENIAKVSSFPEEEKLKNLPARAVVVIGQNFSDGTQMNRADELGVYRKVVEGLVGKGYSVVWKDHPRCLRPFHPDLIREFGPDQVSAFPGLSALPLEISVQGMAHPPMFVGGLSTSLFYLSHLYGCKVFQFADLMLPFLGGEYRPMAVYVAGHIPGVSQIGPVNGVL